VHGGPGSLIVSFRPVSGTQDLLAGTIKSSP
jgi:hypothetical protein